MLFVPKKRDPVTGERTWRMCISYVKLNSKTLNRIAYRLPRIADLLARVSNAQHFSKLDLLSGFYQVRMRDTDIPKTGFSTLCRQFEIKIMPMGLCGAPGTFQMLMDEAFAQPTPVRNISVSFQEFVSIYLDDVCVFSRSFEEHLLHLRAVLSRLREQRAFERLKCAVQDSPMLKHPDQDLPFIVVTDASDYAVGASLEQTDAQGQRRPCLFF